MVGGKKVKERKKIKLRERKNKYFFRFPHLQEEMESKARKIR